ncbi:Zn-ribbon domain-containing protein [Candidatus Woesearchaeota archaeon]|nr:Zn-ribbon domain-containing protein [Candidatus Woesearchaeota archaeon]
MPHQCVSCGAFYEDGAKDILRGCSSCGGKLFFYVKKERIAELKTEEPQLFDLSIEDKKQIEEDVYDILGEEIDRDKPIILDIESIKILKPGKYELDLVNLFKSKQPLIYKLEDGKYMIDIIESFKKMGKGK